LLLVFNFLDHALPFLDLLNRWALVLEHMQLLTFTSVLGGLVCVASLPQFLQSFPPLCKYLSILFSFDYL
jgi:hypothetical protein